MDSRFKFVKSVDPKAVQSNILKPSNTRIKKNFYFKCQQKTKIKF